MYKILTMMGLGFILLTSEVTAAERSSEVKIAKSDGFYAGVGGGFSLGGVVLSNSTYISDGTYNYNVGTMSDTSAGYILFGGYQFNKIIAVEASFTDYGSFSDSVSILNTSSRATFTSDPISGAVYANAGYTFESGWRPFGQLGLGYMVSNASTNLSRLDDFSDDFVTMHYGVGVEYAPASFNGFGLRLAFSGDMTMEYNVIAVDSSGNIVEDAFMMRLYELVYFGAQYKF